MEETWGLDSSVWLYATICEKPIPNPPKIYKNSLILSHKAIKALKTYPCPVNWHSYSLSIQFHQFYLDIMHIVGFLVFMFVSKWQTAVAIQSQLMQKYHIVKWI